MAVLSSAKELKDYALRKLGAPVINIELDDSQTFDRIDDAIELYLEKHYNGVTEVYSVHTVTSQEVTKGYITPNSKIFAVIDVTDINAATNSNSSLEEFDRINFLFANTDLIRNLNTAKLKDYYLTMEHIALLRDILTPSRSFQFNYIRKFLNISGQLTVGQKVIIHGYEVIDPNKDFLIYNDRWIKEYSTALIKRQWGSNVKKYDGIQLPGGVTMNGQQIFDEAQQAITDLEEKLSLDTELPVDFFMAPSFI